MKPKFALAIFLSACLMMTSTSSAVAEIRDGVTPCGKLGQTIRPSQLTEFVCLPSKNNNKKLVFRKLAGEYSLQTINIYSPALTPPKFIPGTSIPWPLPSGEISTYLGIKKDEHADNLLGISSLHEAGITGKGFSIAYIDDGINLTNPAFINSDVICIDANLVSPVLTNCPNPDRKMHGQGVAGTMGGKYGVASEARLISITGEIVKSLEWVLANYKKFNIVSVSLSIGSIGQRSNLVCGVASPAGYGEVLSKLAKEDIAVLFSTANQGTVNWIREPNCLPGVISVASVKSSDPTQIADYSSIGQDIDLLAPADFTSAGIGQSEELFGGTSQATPFAAALFALGKQVRPDANIAQIFYFIKSTAAPVDDLVMKNIPVVRPVEMVAALKSAKELPKIKLVREIQIKSGG